MRTTDFNPAPAGARSGIEKISSGIDASALRMCYVGIDAVKSDRPALGDADVVISGGAASKKLAILP